MLEVSKPSPVSIFYRILHSETHGGALVNLIHGYADNGDPFVRKFTDQLLEEVTHPIDRSIRRRLMSLSSGFETLLCHSAQMAILRRPERPFLRILRGDGS